MEVLLALAGTYVVLQGLGYGHSGDARVNTGDNYSNVQTKSYASNFRLRRGAEHHNFWQVRQDHGDFNNVEGARAARGASEWQMSFWSETPSKIVKRQVHTRVSPPPVVTINPTKVMTNVQFTPPYKEKIRAAIQDTEHREVPFRGIRNNGWNPEFERRRLPFFNDPGFCRNKTLYVGPETLDNDYLTQNPQ